MKAGPGAKAGCPLDEPAGSEEEKVASVFQAGPVWFFSWWRGNGLVVRKLIFGANEFLPLFFAAGPARAISGIGTRVGIGGRAGRLFS